MASKRSFSCQLLKSDVYPQEQGIFQGSFLGKEICGKLRCDPTIFVPLLHRTEHAGVSTVVHSEMNAFWCQAICVLLAASVVFPLPIESIAMFFIVQLRLVVKDILLSCCHTV